MTPSHQPDVPGRAVLAAHNARLSRVYSDETWRLYELLDQSLAPRGPESLYAVAADYLKPSDRVLDAGCRDAAHLLHLVQLYGVTGVGVDPVERHIAKARQRAQEASAGATIDVVVGVMHDLPFPDANFDLI